MLNFGSLIMIKKLRENKRKLKKKLKKFEILLIFLTGKMIIEMLKRPQLKNKRVENKRC